MIPENNEEFEIGCGKVTWLKFEIFLVSTCDIPGNSLKFQLVRSGPYFSNRVCMEKKCIGYCVLLGKDVSEKKMAVLPFNFKQLLTFLYHKLN